MTSDKYCNRERKSAKRFANIQLPNNFKKIGIGIAITSFCMLLINKFIIDSELVQFLSRHGLLIGILFISLAKEKIEDEFIKNLRMQSYGFAFLFCVAYSIFMPYLDYFIDTIRGVSGELKNSGDFMILWILLCIQVFYFEYLKQIFK